MSYQLKTVFYRREFFEIFVRVARRYLPKIRKQTFFKQIFTSEWDDLELKERMRHTTIVLHNDMPKTFRDAAKKLISIAKEIREDPNIDAEFGHVILADYIEVYGLNDFNSSIKAMEEVTQLMTCEYAVRPFIIKYPDKMIAQMQKWSRHKSPAVRRLASEGMRPRLPWAIAVPAFKKDPSPIIPIMQQLKNDPSEDVRRSVANNLNDISKDHPQLMLDIVSKWIGKSPETDKLIKHACRTLLKQGNPRALQLFGFAGADSVDIKNLKLSKAVLKIGETLEFQFNLKIRNKSEPKLRLEYAIYYMKANGKQSKKVFQIAEKVFDNAKSIQIKRRQAFKNLTTRKHYPGKHTLSILVNGIEKVSAHFVLK